MYDSIDFYILQADHPKNDFLSTASKHIKIRSEGISKFGPFMTGEHDVFKVKINQNKISFVEGSLLHYYLKTPFGLLSRGDTFRAIEKLSDELHLPICTAKLTRIDIGQHIPVRYNPKIYFPYLGTCHHYKRLEQADGLYYSNRLRKIVFYDKILKQEFNQMQIPQIYETTNLLRYELRFIGRLSSQFKLPEITCSRLYDADFFQRIVKRWRDEYLHIQKISSNLTGLAITSSPKKLIEQIASLYILENSQNLILSQIKEWQELIKITKKQAFDLRQAVKKITESPQRTTSNEFISELNKKIKEASRFG